MIEENKFKDNSMKTFLISAAHGFNARERSSIFMDHCYARPWKWRPETTLLRPTKTLFMPKEPKRAKTSNVPYVASKENNELIDVDGETQPPSAIYDPSKAKHLMEECERHAAFARINEGNEEWEDSIPRHTWTAAQNRLFNGMAKILNGHYLARLAYAGNWNEPILRRTLVDKSVKRTRQLMAGVSWDTRLTQWLHIILIDNLSTAYLAIYLDVLQTLKAKLPTFVDKMMFGPTASNRIGITSNESLFPLLKRPWDPVATSLAQDKPKKLPGNPIIVIVPSTLTVNGPHASKRLHKWTTLLSNLASVITVHANIGSRNTMTSCADQMFAATRAKVQEIRSDCPGRPIVLAGFNTGAAIACQIAQVENTLAVFCLGFPLLTTEGRRGEADDILLELQSPVLFIIGQNAYVTSQEDMEDLRERMRVETGLVVVGGADDYMRINKRKKCLEGITQSIVDRCVVDEIGEFIGSILLSPYPTQVRPPPLYIQNEANKRSKADRKRNNSNCSSIESEPPSPQPMKLGRPVGRPPGSKKGRVTDPKPILPQLLQGIHPSVPISPTPYTIPSPSSDTVASDTTTVSTNRSISTSEEILTPNTPDALENAIKSITPTASTTTAVSQLQTLGGYSNRNIISTSGSTLSSLLQTTKNITASITSQPIRTSNSSIKILENIKLSSGTTIPKLVSSTGRLIDMSKITVLNSLNAQKTSNLGNIIVLPDGSKCVRNINSPTVKGTGSAPITFPFTHKTPQPVQKRIGVTKYITSKKQLVTSTPNSARPPTTSTYVTPESQQKIQNASNLTTADIMDLPIIFADNDSSLITDMNSGGPLMNSSVQNQPLIITTKQSTVQGNAPGKYVFINKQTTLQQPTSLTFQGGIKRQLHSSVSRTIQSSQPVKYTKIILSKRGDDSKQIVTKYPTVNHDLNVKKSDDPMMGIDLETELIATAVPKPGHMTIGAKPDRIDQHVKIIQPHKIGGLLEAVLKKESPIGPNKHQPQTSKSFFQDHKLFQDLESNVDDPESVPF